MTKVYVERRDRSGRVIERLGPFAVQERSDDPGSASLRQAVAAQMQIADLHDRTRRPSDESFQMVYEVKEE